MKMTTLRRGQRRTGKGYDRERGGNMNNMISDEKKAIRAVLFDLDGTLLPMDQDTFVKTYFGLLAKKLAPLGYEAEKLFQTIWLGIQYMVKNDGSRTNEEVFWDVFAEVYGQEALKDKPVIDKFYTEEFNQAAAVCGSAPEAKEIVDLVKAGGRIAALATNPIFPAAATENRMRWTGLAPEDFALWTTYENSGFSKPNPEYYLDVARRIGCRPEECLMVGNDVIEDMVTAEKAGMKVFLLTDCIINKEDADISVYPHGGFEKLKEYIAGL